MTVAKSDMGFQTRTWGIACWHFLHIVSLNYPNAPKNADKQRYLRFFRSIGDVLPCSACRLSYKNITNKGHTKLTTFTLKSRASLARWLYDVHNEVSKRTGKNKDAISFKEMCRRYESCRATKCGGHKCDVPSAKHKKRAVMLLVPEEKFVQAKTLKTLIAGHGNKKITDSFINLT